MPVNAEKPTEADHATEWVPTDRARALLHEKASAWAVTLLPAPISDGGRLPPQPNESV